MTDLYRIVVSALVGFGLVLLADTLQLWSLQANAWADTESSKDNHEKSTYDCEVISSAFENYLSQELIKPESVNWNHVHIDLLIRYSVLKQTPVKDVLPALGVLIEYIAQCRANGSTALWFNGREAISSRLTSDKSRFKIEVDETFAAYMQQIEILQAYSPEKVERFCSKHLVEVSELQERNKISYLDNYWRKVSFDDGMFKGDIVKLEERLHHLLRVISICKSKGPVSAFRGKDKQIAHMFLRPDLEIVSKFYIVSKGRRKELIAKQKEKDEKKKECTDLAVKAKWLAFQRGELVRTESDYSEVYVDKSWNSFYLDRKEALVNFVGKCKSKGIYLYFYDAHDGKKLARYDPVFGATIYAD